MYSFDGNIILPVEFSEIDTNKWYFVVKDVSDLCGLFSLKGENIVPISFENIGAVKFGKKFGKDKDSIDAVSVIKEGTRGWYIIKYKSFVTVDEVNITKTGIIEVCVEGKWYILDDTKYLNIVH